MMRRDSCLGIGIFKIHIYLPLTMVMGFCNTEYLRSENDRTIEMVNRNIVPESMCVNEAVGWRKYRPSARFIRI